MQASAAAVPRVVVYAAAGNTEMLREALAAGDDVEATAPAAEGGWHALHKQLEEKPAKVAAQERVQSDITSLEEKIESLGKD